MRIAQGILSFQLRARKSASGRRLAAHGSDRGAERMAALWADYRFSFRHTSENQVVGQPVRALKVEWPVIQSELANSHMTFDAGKAFRFDIHGHRE
jgi:hypothetical protein